MDELIGVTSTVPAAVSVFVEFVFAIPTKKPSTAIVGVTTGRLVPIGPTATSPTALFATGSPARIAVPAATL